MKPSTWEHKQKNQELEVISYTTSVKLDGLSETLSQREKKEQRGAEQDR